MNKIVKTLSLPFINLIKVVSPTLFVKLQYKYITGHKLNLENPVRYTEKLQVLRLRKYPNNKLVNKCTSRDGARDYLKELGLEQYLVPSLGIYNNFDDIDFKKLPHSFVLKCTHASGFNLVVEDKEKLNLEKAKKRINKWLKTNYGNKTVEKHYSNIKPKILIEQYLGKSPLEYKIHVFNGKAKYLYVVSERGTDIKYNNYYINWEKFDGAQFNGWKTSSKKIEKPCNFDEMITVAEKLGSKFPFVRVDLYNINGKIYFGEMTFTPAKGTLKFDNDDADFEIGKWLSI